MFAKSPIHAKLDEKILTALKELDQLDAKSEEYGTVVDSIAKLHKLKAEEASTELKITETNIKIGEIESKTEADSKFKLPSSDTLLVVGANIFGIVWLARYEKEHVVTSKSALGFVMRPR